MVDRPGGMTARPRAPITRGSDAVPGVYTVKDMPPSKLMAVPVM